MNALLISTGRYTFFFVRVWFAYFLVVVAFLGIFFSSFVLCLCVFIPEMINGRANRRLLSVEIYAIYLTIPPPNVLFIYVQFSLFELPLYSCFRPLFFCKCLFFNSCNVFLKCFQECTVFLCCLE